MNISTILQELHKRRQGYLFGGPSKDWCLPHNHQEKYLKIGGIKYSGCSKYSSCDQIDEISKWTEWEELTTDQKDKLKECHCYRTPNFYKTSSLPTWKWDSDFLSDRYEHPWIGNPFGIRSFKNIEHNWDHRIEKEYSFRDINPCRIGGCVTPEMQSEYQKTDYNSDSKIKVKILIEKDFWKNIEACPYFFRAKNESFDSFEKNIARFAQCYVTLHDVRNILQHNGFITGAPLFRDIVKLINHHKDEFWYPFFSGYSYVQLLYQVNQDPGWQRFSAQLRWHATSIQRVSSIDMDNKYLPNTKKIFEKCDHDGNLLDKYEQQQRFLDVCDGNASWLLLTWVLIQRHSSAFAESKSIEERLSWEYLDGLPLYTRLAKFGFKEEMENILSSTIKENNIQGHEVKTVYRTSTLNEDLILLGILDDSLNPTKRYEYLVTWLMQSNISAYELDLQVLVKKLKKTIAKCSALSFNVFPVSYTHLTLPTNREV